MTSTESERAQFVLKENLDIGIPADYPTDEVIILLLVQNLFGATRVCVARKDCNFPQHGIGGRLTPCESAQLLFNEMKLDLDDASIFMNKDMYTTHYANVVSYTISVDTAIAIKDGGIYDFASFDGILKYVTGEYDEVKFLRGVHRPDYRCTKYTKHPMKVAGY